MTVVDPPSFRLTLGSLDFSNPELNRRVIKISVECQGDGPDSFVVELDDANQDPAQEPFTNGQYQGAIKEGDIAKIQLGYTPKRLPVLDGTVTKVEAFRHSRERKIFKVSGFDHMHKLTRGRHRRSWLNIKDSDIASQFAQEVGMSAKADDSGIVHDYVFQNNQTNLEFLYERARRLGFEIDSKDKDLLFHKHKKTGPVCTLFWDAANFVRNGTDRLVEDIKFSTTAMGQLKEVIVRHYDPATKEQIEGRSTDVINGSMGGSVTGASASQEASSGVGHNDGEDPTTKVITDQPVRTVEEAEKLAWSILNQQAGFFVTAKGKCEGYGAIMPNAYVKVDAFGTTMDGEYIVTSAKHTYSTGGGGGHGYVTEFELKRTGHN